MLRDLVEVATGDLKVLLCQLHFDHRSRQATGVKLFEEVEHVEVSALDKLDLGPLELALGVDESD